VKQSYRTVVYSDFAAWPRVFNAVVYEFAKVLAEVADADVIAPPARTLSRKRDKVFDKLLWQGSRWRGRPARTVTTELVKTCDVFVFIGAFMDTLSELRSLRGWRDRSGLKIAYIVEAWAGSLAAQKAYMQILADFDYVFLLHANTIPLLQESLGVPCAFLPTAVDALEAAPHPRAPPRTIDVLSIGRRSEPAHRCLLEMARSGDFYYDFDSARIADAPVHDWAQHRFLTFSKIKRAKFFVCYDHLTAGAHKFVESRGDQVLPARLFEGAAGGSVMIGSAPRCPEFDKTFHWPDAVVAMPVDPGDIPSFLYDLARQHERLSQVRAANVLACLQAHDWGHRWGTILEAVGLDPAPSLILRQEKLAALAADMMRATGVLPHATRALPVEV
jgi:hypothetical protein